MELVFVVWLLGWVICSVAIGAEGTGKIHKVWLFTPLIILVLGAAIPNRETTYAMAAAYGVQTIVENETANELASDGVDVLKAWMKKAKTELEQSTEGG